MLLEVGCKACGRQRQWGQRGRIAQGLIGVGSGPAGQRLARADELQAEREERAREALAETERWLAAWRAGLEQLALIDRERLPWARQRVDLAQATYRGGNARLGDVLATRRTALALEMERVDLHLSTALLWARLKYLLPDVFPSDAAPLASTATTTQKD